MADSTRRRAVAGVQSSGIKHSKHNPVSRIFHAKSDKDAIAAWRLDLNKILHVFNVHPPFPLQFMNADR